MLGVGCLVFRHYTYMYSTRHLLCIKTPLEHMQFWCSINDEYCIWLVYIKLAHSGHTTDALLWLVGVETTLQTCNMCNCKINCILKHLLQWRVSLFDYECKFQTHLYYYAFFTDSYWINIKANSKEDQKLHKRNTVNYIPSPLIFHASFLTKKLCRLAKRKAQYFVTAT